MNPSEIIVRCDLSLIQLIFACKNKFEKGKSKMLMYQLIVNVAGEKQ